MKRTEDNLRDLCDNIKCTNIRIIEVPEKEEKIKEMFNKDLKELKGKQTEVNNTITEMKNILEGINNNINEAEKQISEPEDILLKITAMEQNKEKRMKRNEDSLRDLWDNIKHTNIHIIGVPGEERERV